MFLEIAQETAAALQLQSQKEAIAAVLEGSGRDCFLELLRAVSFPSAVQLVTAVFDAHAEALRQHQVPPELLQLKAKAVLRVARRAAGPPARLHSLPRPDVVAAPQSFHDWLDDGVSASDRPVPGRVWDALRDWGLLSETAESVIVPERALGRERNERPDGADAAFVRGDSYTPQPSTSRPATHCNPTSRVPS